MLHSTTVLFVWYSGMLDVLPYDDALHIVQKKKKLSKP